MAWKSTPIAVKAGRTVVSACWTAGCWILWIVLLTVAGFLVTVHFTREIPVPDFILHRLEDRFELAGLSPRFGATRFDTTGTLVLEDLRVQSPMFAEPVASARAVVLNLNLWSIFVGDFDVDSVQVIGLELNCPAMLSPSGTNLPVVSNLHATFVRDGQRWRVPSADFRIGQLAATVRGEWDPLGSSGSKLPVDPKEWVKRYYDVARTIATKLDQLAILGETRLDVSFTIRRNQPLHIAIEGDAERLVARGLTLANVHLRIDHNDGRRPAPPLLVEVTAPGVLIEDRVNVVHPRIRESGEISINPFKFTPGPLEFSAESISAEGATIDSVIFRSSLSGLPVIEGEVAAAHGGSIVTALGSVDPRDGSVSANVAARLVPATIEEGLGIAMQHSKSVTIRRIHFAAPVSLEGEVRLGDHWKFKEARGWFRTENADLSGVSANIAAGSFELTPEELFADNLVLEGKDLHGEGSYRMRIKSRDYRFLVTGRTYPEAIDPWFMDWWERFWSRFTFSHDRPLNLDLSIAGRWGNRHKSNVVGSVESGAMTIRGIPFDSVATRIFTRDEYYDILSVEGAVGDRGITGSFIYDDREAGDLKRRIQYQAKSTLEMPKYAGATGPELPKILEPYSFENPPAITTSGTVDFLTSGKIVEDVTAQVESTGRFRFFEFPVKDATFNVRSRHGTVDVTDVNGIFGSGRLTATVHSAEEPAGRTVQFTARLENAKLDEAAAEFNDYRRRSSKDGKEISESLLSGKGILNAQIEASGPASDMWGFTGKGTATISQAELGHIRVLGPLSKLFEGTILNFTSFRLTNADSVFAINGDRLVFSKLELTGPSAQIRSFGNFRMPTSELEFNTTIFPFRESSMPVMNVLGFVLEPFSRALELRLSGTAEKPKWAFAAGATVPKYEPVKPPVLIPDDSPPADGSRPATSQPSGP